MSSSLPKQITSERLQAAPHAYSYNAPLQELLTELVEKKYDSPACYAAL